MAVKVFMDFDGTVTVRDVGNDVFGRFSGGRNQEAIDRYHDERLSAHDLFQIEAALAGAVSHDELNALIDAEVIDDGFVRFIAFCRTRDLDPCILSDGLDYYVDRILLRSGAGEVPRFANHLRLIGAVPASDASQAGDGAGRVTLALEFPAGNADCDRCACCKRNIMLGRAGEEDVIVYVGEGYSDRCPARYADLVFAKKSLQTYCQNENISYLPYTTFDDVRTQLGHLLEKGAVRKRRRAELERRAAWRAE